MLRFRVKKFGMDDVELSRKRRVFGVCGDYIWTMGSLIKII